MRSVSKWPERDFGTVYALKYNADGELDNFSRLNNQYPIATIKSWKSPQDKIEKQ
jgi:hypothetical protein